MRFVSIFSGASATTLGPAAGGIACESNAAIVVLIHERDLHVVKQHFLSQGLEESNSVRNVEEKETWYEIVDGNYRHEAILVLMDSSPDWKDFKWTVTEVNSEL